MTTTPPVEPRKVVPLEDCPYCYGGGQIVGEHLDYEACECVLDQLTYANQPFTIDTTPNDLTKWVDVVEP